jgi:CBS domain-containing protein
VFVFDHLKVKDMMNSKVHVVAPDITVWQASNKLKTLHVGCLVVVENNVIVGIISERDIVYKIVSAKKDATTVKVREIMNGPVITVKPETPANDALFISSTRHLRHIPVVNDKGDLVGLLGIRDLIYQAVNNVLASQDYLDMNPKKASNG